MYDLYFVAYAIVNKEVYIGDILRNESLNRQFLLQRLITIFFSYSVIIEARMLAIQSKECAVEF